jgi:protein-S-isoprenylcysteine O-methyltransferase Ste14
MTTASTAPNRLPWPPMIYLAAIVAGIVLSIVVPLPWIGEPISDILFAVGCLMVLLAVIVGIEAIRKLRRAKTTVVGGRASEHLVTNGPFAVTRNPIYLAMTILVIGIGLISEIVWFLPLALIAAFATQKLAIGPEESHLEQQFGKRYRDYAKRVRRWF